MKLDHKMTQLHYSSIR